LLSDFVAILPPGGSKLPPMPAAIGRLAPARTRRIADEGRAANAPQVENAVQ